LLLNLHKDLNIHIMNICTIKIEILITGVFNFEIDYKKNSKSIALLRHNNYIYNLIAFNDSSNFKIAI